MAIQYQPTGYGAAVEKTAIGAGQAQAAMKTLEMAQEMADRDRQRRFQIEMANIQDQSALELEKRRQLFEIEKMETRSRIDFAEEEQTRQKKKEQFKLDMDSLDKAIKDGIITADKGSQYKELRMAKEMGIESGALQMQKPLSSQQVMGKMMMDNLIRQGKKPEEAKAQVESAIGEPLTATGQTTTAPATVAPVKPTGIQPTAKFPKPNVANMIMGTPDKPVVMGMKSDGTSEPVNIEAGKSYEFIDPKTGNRGILRSEAIIPAVQDLGYVIQGERKEIAPTVETIPTVPIPEVKKEEPLSREEEITRQFVASLTGKKPQPWTPELEEQMIVKHAKEVAARNKQPLKRTETTPTVRPSKEPAPERISSEPISEEEAKSLGRKEIVYKNPGEAKKTLVAMVSAKLNRFLDAREAVIVRAYFEKNSPPNVTGKQLDEMSSKVVNLLGAR